MFLKQYILRGGLPFAAELPQYRSEVVEAMEEAKKISKDTSVKSYIDMDEMFRELND